MIRRPDDNDMGEMRRKVLEHDLRTYVDTDILRYFLWLESQWRIVESKHVGLTDKALAALVKNDILKPRRAVK